MVAPSRARISPIAGVVVVVAALCAVRVWFLRIALIPDEGGFYLVAKTWSLHGKNLYGHYFVDRPPGLIVVYKLAALTGHVVSIRVLSAAAAVVTVLALARAAQRLGLPVVAPAVVAGALLSNPVDESIYGSSGLFAVPWVALAFLGTVEMMQSERARSYVFATLTGVAATIAVSVKQNYADGFAFAGVVLLVHVLQRRSTLRLALLRGVAITLGAAVVVAAMVVQSLFTEAGPKALWLAAVTFRFQASAVLADTASRGTAYRLTLLTLVLVVSGIVPLVLALLLRALRSGFRGSPWAWGCGVVLLMDVPSMVLGGSYWPHYALQVIPAAALAVALAWRISVLTRLAVGLVVVSALVNVIGFALHVERKPSDKVNDVGQWVARSSTPSDTATVLFGHGQAQLATGLQSPYEHLWSLPIRTLDPHLAELNGLLAQDATRPTWMLLLNPPNAFDLDKSGDFRASLRHHYVQVATVCRGTRIWLRRDQQRALTPAPRCTANAPTPIWYLQHPTARITAKVAPQNP